MRLQSLLAAALLSAAAPALAAPPAARPAPSSQAEASSAAPSQPKVGVGISLASDGNFSSPAEILVPIILNPTIRVEPSLGILTRNFGGGASSRDIVLGVGVFMAKRAAPSTDLLFGGRLKLGFAKVDNGVADDSGNDILVAGAAGAEHWFSDRFTVGLEAQLGFYSLSEVSGDASGLFTQGLVIARLYL